MFLGRHRGVLIAGAAVVALAGIGLLIGALSRDGDTGLVAETVPNSPEPTIIASSSTSEDLRPGEVVATTSVDELPVFDAAGGTQTTTLGKWSYYGQALTLLATAATELDGATWYQVLLPMQPNGSTGWIRAADVTTTSTDVEIHIFLAEHELDLVLADSVTLTAPIAIGAEDTPTPPGLYSITDPLDFTINPTGVYGAYALGLSGFSEVLETFNGGPPQLAIHGTNHPELIGQSVSNGCIRMHNEDVLVVAQATGLGTPVYVHVSRAEA